MKLGTITKTVVSPPEYNRLVVELEVDGDAIATVTMEADEPVVEFKHLLARRADTNVVSPSELVAAIEDAAEELVRLYGAGR
jgi:hypothetical protein